MCMEDIKLGRSLGWEMGTTATALGGTTIIIPADPKRTRIVFLGDGTNLVSAYPKGFNGGQGRGVHVTAGAPVAIVRVEDYGPLVTQAWLADDGGLGAQLSWVLTTLERTQ